MAIVFLKTSAIGVLIISFAAAGLNEGLFTVFHKCVSRVVVPGPVLTNLNLDIRVVLVA